MELEYGVAFIWCGSFQMLLLFLFACILVLANSESSVQVHYLLAPTFSPFGRWGSSSHPLGSQALEDRVKLSMDFHKTLLNWLTGKPKQVEQIRALFAKKVTAGFFKNPGNALFSSMQAGGK